MKENAYKALFKKILKSNIIKENNSCIFWGRRPCQAVEVGDEMKWNDWNSCLLSYPNIIVINKDNEAKFNASRVHAQYLQCQTGYQISMSNELTSRWQTYYHWSIAC